MRWLVLILLVVSPSCGPEKRPPPQPSTLPAKTVHLHLPGIGGYRSIDRMFLQGLQQGGLDAEFRPYDWTENDPGLGALLTTEMHTTEATKVAQMLAQLARENPHAKLTVSVHSGGAGIIVWALEQMPDDFQIESLLLLSPALSPQYDLSKAMRHVRGKVYAFYSPYDVAVLGIGTHMFGTIDGVKTDAAGKAGFAKPKGADESQYAKLVQVPYDSSWVRVGNIGDHIGTLSRPFARRVVAPLLLTGNLPKITSEPLKTPATLPTGAPPTPPGATTTPAIPTPAQ